MFGQVFETHDIVVVAFLVLLEGVLSIDNALVLGLLAKRLPEHQRKRALTYGLVGAFVFRLIAIAFAQLLLSVKLVKVVGGGYLLFIALKYLIGELLSRSEEKFAVGADNEPTLVNADGGLPLSEEAETEELQARVPIAIPERVEEDPNSLGATNQSEDQSSSAKASRDGSGKLYAKFWPTVMVIEFTDMAFAVDSILAAIALVGPKPSDHVGLHPKLWVVVTGGMLGVILMRLAAVVFIRLLEKFPRFETSAYLLVSVIGLKLILDYLFNDYMQSHLLNFHEVNSVAFWGFWGLMLLCFLFGFLPSKKKPSHG